MTWPKPEVKAGDLVTVRRLDGRESLYLVMRRQDKDANEFSLELLPDWEPAPEAEDR